MKIALEKRGVEGGYSIDQFRDEIADFVAREVSGEIASGHFLISGTATREPSPEFDVSQLTEEDRRVWEKIKNGTIAMDAFHRYAQEVDALDDHDPAKRSRVIFSEFAGNKAMRALFESSDIQKIRHHNINH